LLFAILNEERKQRYLEFKEMEPLLALRPLGAVSASTSPAARTRRAQSSADPIRVKTSTKLFLAARSEAVGDAAFVV